MRRIRVSVARHLPDGFMTVALDLPAGSTLADALRESCLAPPQPGEAAGVFGRPAPAEHVLREGDRVEIYRALCAEPKEARRARVNAERRRKRTAR